jgi:hypothetical protein
VPADLSGPAGPGRVARAGRKIRTAFAGVMTLPSQTRSLYLGGGSTTRFALAGVLRASPLIRPVRLLRPVRLVLAVLLPPLFVLVHLVLAGLVLVLAALVLVLASLVLVLAGLVLVGLVLILGLSRRGALRNCPVRARSASGQ